MVRHILRHEWRALVADRSWAILLLVFGLAIGYGTVTGVRWTGFQRQAIAEADREERERFETHQRDMQAIAAGSKKVSAFNDPRNPDSAGRRLAVRYAVMPPAPLAPLAIGQSDLLPYYLRVSTDTREAAMAATEIENPHRLLSGRFDLAFVLVYLYPLLVIALSYNVLSGEKEEGTLALALSQPVSLASLVVAKLGLRLMLFVAAIVTLTLIALLVTGVSLGAPGVGPRLAAWVAAVVAYGLLWFAAAVAVIARGYSSSTNATALAALWLLVTIVVPSTLNLLANTLYPVPSRVALVQAMRAASDEANTRGSQLLARYYEDHPELAPDSVERAMNQASLIRVATNTEIEARVQPVLRTFEVQRASQQRLVGGLRWLSPALLLQEALNDLSGTGTARHEAFLAQVGAFHEQWRGFFVPLVFTNAPLDTLQNVPRFTFQDETDRGVARRVAPNVLGLVAAAGLIGLSGLRALRRYPVVA
jgi:ABC-2 type transport system permease protein